MNQSAINLKRNSQNNTLRNSLISKGGKISKQKNLNNSTLNIEHKYKNENIFEENKMLSKAYKNIIKVIANILGNIEEEKINGKTNMLKINSRRRTVFKKKSDKRIQKIPINTSSKSMNLLVLDNNQSFISKKSVNKSSSINIKSNKNFNIPNIKIIKADNNDNSNHNLINNSYNNINEEKSNLNMSHFSITKNNRNRLKLKNDTKRKLVYHNSNKIIPKSLTKKLSFIKSESSKNSIISLNSEDNNSISSSSFTTINSKRKKIRKSISKQENNHLKLSTKYLNSKRQKSSRRDFHKSNQSIKTINKSKKHKSIRTIKTIKSMRSLSELQNKINISNSNLHKTLYEYENNEITDAIKKLPKFNKENKNRLRRRRTLIFTQELRDIIELNPNKDSLLRNFEKFSKEKNYRCLLFKGNVYDSLNDEEESEEEIDDYFCYFEPDSIFLYILDGIILFFSLIILLYLPYYLAKNLYYCQYIFDINTIIFYIIDFAYIFDLIINFYRSYYNFDEYLVKANIYICIHYFKTWFLLDFICSIPVFSILKSLENKCIGNSIYNRNHYHYYNTNPHNIHYLFGLIKVIKTIKIFKKNITLHKIGKILCGSEFLTDWGNVILYSFFLLSFLNLSACFFIFIGRNSINNWIFNNSLDMQTFSHIYIGSIYYVIETVTTVGYGDLIGQNLNEIIFQVMMLIVGTCIYSWLISSISNYIQKINEKNTQYDKKLEILEEIKLNNPHLNNKLYDKILRLIHYRKYHEDETEKNIVLDSLPNSLKNSLIIEMYKKFINDFIFFKGIDNKEFIVQIISKLNPIIGIKGDTLIKEGEYIDNIIFIKDGIVSLEISIDINYPEKSIEQYLWQYGYINKPKIEDEHNSNDNLKKINYKKSYRHAKPSKKSFDKYYYDLIRIKTKKFIINENEKKSFNDEQTFEIERNMKRIKVLDIRKNEHYGDVLMFLNKKSPLSVRVRSNKADLLLLKKLDALKISTNYPNIWKKIIKKPLANSKIIQNLTLKILVSFCNYYGIKTNLFKKRKNKKYPPYYLKPVFKDEINPTYTKKNPKIKTLMDLVNEKESIDNNEEEKEEDSSSSFEIKDQIEKNNNKIDYKKNPLNRYNSDKILLTNNNKKNKDLLNNKAKENNNYKHTKTINNYNCNILDLEINGKKLNKSLSSEENEKNSKNTTNNNYNNNSSFSFKNVKMSKSNSCTSQKTIKNINTNYLSSPNKLYKPTLFKNNTKISSNQNNSSTKIFTQNEADILEFKYDDINDEIYPGENSIIKEYKNEKTKKIKHTKKNEIPKIPNIISDNVYINNFNIIKSPYFETYYNNNYNIQNFDKNEIKKFKSLKITSLISTINIKSSYQNINKITNNKYISNEQLQLKTKNFLIKECNIDIDGEKRKNKLNTDIKLQKSLKKPFHNYRISYDAFDNNSFIKNYTHKINSISSIKNDFEKIKQKYIDNKINNKDVLFKNKEHNKKLASAIHLSIKNNLHNIDHFHKNYTKNKQNHLGLGTNIILEEKLEENSGITNTDKKSDDDNNNSNKRKKKEKEMDIISKNIQKSSQNLNQPDVFYADLFSHLIYKNTKNKFNSSNKILKASNILQKNEIDELLEKSQNFFSDEFSKE